MKNKRGQEEIVGFVLIMVIVVVVLVVFLGISLRDNQATTRESTDIYQFLESMGEVTSECQIRNSEFADIAELFAKCDSNELCLNDIGSCQVLESELRVLLDSSWNVGENASIRGYKFASSYASNSDAEKEEILTLEKGTCGGNIRGASYLIPAFPGRIVNTLELCY